MKSFWLALAALGLACPAPNRTPPPVAPRPAPAPAPPPAPPADAAVEAAPAALAPPEPTLRLPRNFVPTGYDAELAIEPGRPGFSGTITISGNVAQPSSVIWLHGYHLKIDHATATAGGSPAQPLVVTPHGSDLLELRADPPLAAGAWQVRLAYSGAIDRVNTTGVFEETAGGAPYVFTQFEAVYARRAFPCLDEPDVKVPWKLALDVPQALVAVSNTPIESETPLPGGKKQVAFERTPPLPSYLVAFGVGPFDFVDAGKTRAGVPIRIVVPKGRAADAAWAARTASHVLALLEDWFGTPYPYKKLDLLAVPLTVGFGAMENAGLITFSEGLVLMDAAHTSWARKQTWIIVSAHEMAHQWFGDLVTTAWWDDIWLNEGFANWMETKIAAELEPSWDEEQLEVTERQRALRADSLVSARRIRQPIDSPSDIYNVFDGITYDKGGSVLAMFEHYVGPEAFQRGVRAYLKQRAFGNATEADFVSAVDAATGKDLAAAFATFLDQPGAPELDATLACTGGPPRVELAQHRYVPAGAPTPPAERPWIVPVCVVYERGGKRAEACTMLDAPTGTLALDTATCPRWMMPNADARGYYRLHLAVPAITALRDEGWPLLSWTERRELFFEVAAAARQARLPLQLALSFVPKLLAGGDRFTIGDAVDFVLGLEPFVPDELRGKYEVAARELFDPGAARLGPLPRPSDDLDAESVRDELFRAAAWHGRDPELVRQAVELAGHWHDVPDAMRVSILRVAADASPAVYDQLLHDVKTERDLLTRRQILAALAAVRDPARLKTALALLLDPALDLRETEVLLAPQGYEPTRQVAEQFFRAHARDLIARLPSDEVRGGAAGIAFLFTAACDAHRRDEVVGYVTQHFAALPGGARIVKQAIEAMDQCIARRAALEPELRAWLGGLRLPRPDAKLKRAKGKQK